MSNFTKKFSDSDNTKDDEKSTFSSEEAVYSSAVLQMCGGKNENYKSAIELLKQIPNWKDARVLIEACENNIRHIEQKNREAVESNKKRLASKKRKKALKTIGIVITVCAIVATLSFLIVSLYQNSQRKKSEDEKLRNGVYYKLSKDEEYYIAYCLETDYPESIKILSEYKGKPVTEIGDEAFADSSIKEIEIPDSITTIDNYAFRNCKSLISITIPDSVTEISTWGHGAFGGCTGIRSITGSIGCASRVAKQCGSDSFSVIITSGTSVGNEAFHGAKGLTNVELPDSITQIRPDAFSGCSGLKTINFPKSLTKIMNGAFSGCVSLDDITFPDGLTEIDEYAFSECTGLTSLTIPSGTKIYGTSFCGCKGLKTIIGSITKLSVVSSWCYSDGFELIVTSGESVGYEAFEYSKVSTVYLPDECNSIGSRAFVGSKISKIVLSKNITKIDQSAFADCSNLKEIVYPGTIAQWDEIQKGKEWDRNTGYYIIHCSDGDIEKNK